MDEIQLIARKCKRIEGILKDISLKLDHIIKKQSDDFFRRGK